MPRRGLTLVICLLILLGGFGLISSLFQSWTPPPESRMKARPTTAMARPQVVPEKRIHPLPWDPHGTPRWLPLSEVHRYSFQLEADEILEAAVEQNPVRGQEIDVALRLYKLDGSLAYEIDNPTGTTRADKVFFLADLTGRYELEVDGRDAEGTYRLSHISIHKASEKDRINARAEALFYNARTHGRKIHQHPAALSEYQQAELLWRSVGNKQREADALDRRSSLLTGHGRADWEEMLDLQTRARKLFHEAGDREFELKMLIACGVSQKTLGRLSEAESSFGQVLSAARKEGYSEQEADALRKLGSLYEQKGQLYRALDYFEKSLLFYQSRKRLSEQIELLDLRGLIYQSLGYYSVAKELFEQAGRLLEVQDDAKLRGLILARLSEVYDKMGQPSMALSYALQALAFRQKAQDRHGEAQSLGEIGLIYREMGDFARARAYQENAVSVFQRLKEGRSEANAHDNLGLVLLDEGNIPGAIEQLKRGAELSRTQGDPAGELTALYGLALAYERSGNPLRARAVAEDAVRLAETLPRGTGNEGNQTSSDASREGAHEILIRLLVASPASYTSLADRSHSFEISEMSRGRTLLDSLSSEQVGSGWLKGADPVLLAQYESVKKDLVNNDEQLRRSSASRAAKLLSNRNTQLHEQALMLERRLRESSPWRDTVRPAAINLKAAQSMLDGDTVLLEYSLGRERSFLWLVTESSDRLIDLPGRDVIERKANEFYGLIKESRRSDKEKRAMKAGRDLSELLLRPVSGLLGKHIVIVRDGALHYVPFSVLPDPSELLVRGERGGRLEPLIAKHDITYLPSMSVLHAIREVTSRRRPATRLLGIFANPVFVPEEYQELPFSAEEADKVRALPSASEQPLLLSRFAATRAAALSGILKDFRFLLFATHSQNHPEQPNLSAIVLSQLDTKGRRIEGELRLQDVKSLDLAAELVVLSACSTAPGTEIRGEGFVGLTQGFMYAGASRVVVSLWNVNDQAAPALIERLFSGILKDHLAPAESLRQAQIWMYQQGRAPYYWGGFEIHGEYR